MKPCKHLDYDGDYTDCTIQEAPSGILGESGVRYWERGPTWTEGPGNEENPRNVQFCKLRGRINSIFDCYQPPGPMRCHEPEEKTDGD
ncbi:MAG: hypothetical protein GY769_08100 [bacterium]|nr:hypothetical protein [bacterium]